MTIDVQHAEELFVVRLISPTCRNRLGDIMCYKIYLYLAVIMAAASTGLSSGINYNGDDNMLRIEMDIFSGRENPFWNLNMNESEIFMQKFASLPEEKEISSVEVGLGYRGFIITGDLIKDSGFGEIRIFRGLAKAKSEDRFLNLSDPGRALELWLIETSANHIDKDLYELVKQDTSNMN